MHALLVPMLDCSRYSPDNGSAACEEQSNVAIGVIVIIGLVVFAGSYIWWRRNLAKHRDSDSEYPPGVVGDWRDRRARRRAKQAEVHRRLEREYMEGIESQDPVTLEAEDDVIRVPLKMQVGMTAYILMLFVAVPLLIGFFVIIKALAGD